MTDNIEHKFLDKLSRDVAISIDTKALYTAMGWTIVQAPFRMFLYQRPVTAWLDTHCGKYHYWDGQVAFEHEQDATLFTLRWS